MRYDINDENIKLAIIYERVTPITSMNILSKSKSCLSFETAALVSYASIDNSFTVISGKHKGMCQKDFRILNGGPDFIYGNNATLSYNQDDEEDELENIYIFDNDFVNTISDKEELTKIKTLCKIVEFAQCVNLYQDHSTICVTYLKSVRGSKNNKLSRKEIVDILTIGKEEEIKNEISNMTSRGNIILGFYAQDELIREFMQRTQSQETTSLESINILKVIDGISAKIICQEEAIRSLVSNLYFNQVLINSLADVSLKQSANELDSRKVAVLLDGTTGTGKTAIVKEIATVFDVPIEIVNANSFSETGYIGPTITDILQKLYDKANGDLTKAERGIVVLDEIDKIAETDLESRSMKLGVQKELLGFMSGAEYNIGGAGGLFGQPPINFNTSKLTFILSGAFTSIKDKKIAQKNALGFISTDKNENPSEKTYVMDSKDYIDFGLMREFFGRVKVITSTKTYGIDDLKRILLESELSPLKGFEKTCKMFGYPGIKYDMEFIDKVASDAYAMATGARALQNLISGIQDILLIDLISKKFDINEPVELTTDLLEKYKQRKIRTY